LIANSGNFVETTPLLWRDGSPFHGFMRFSDWLYAQTHQTHSIALARLHELVARYLIEEAGQSREEVQQALDVDSRRSRVSPLVDAPPRQARHLTASRQTGRSPNPV
jgi:hypothetical protein